MQIESTRFGVVDINDDAVLTFPDGLIGLPGTRYALIAQSDRTAFYWLHSLDSPAVALPVTSPWLFFSDYEVRVPTEDEEKLRLEGPEQADILCVVRAGEQLEDFTANLKGPLVINASTRIGRQIINEAAEYGVREPLFSEIAPNEVQPATPAAPVAATGV